MCPQHVSVTVNGLANHLIPVCKSLIFSVQTLGVKLLSLAAFKSLNMCMETIMEKVNTVKQVTKLYIITIKSNNLSLSTSSVSDVHLEMPDKPQECIHLSQI